MKEIYDLGLSISTIESMIDLNPDIKELSSNEFYIKKSILKELGCTDNQIRNIVGSNSLFLTRTNMEIIRLLELLINYGFKMLNILLDSNPYILNLEPFEIKKYVDSSLSKGLSLEDIIDELNNNPSIFNDM